MFVIVVRNLVVGESHCMFFSVGLSGDVCKVGNTVALCAMARIATKSSTTESRKMHGHGLYTWPGVAMTHIAFYSNI